MSNVMLECDIVLMIGLPASGKSSLIQAYQSSGYVILSRDSGTMESATDLNAVGFTRKSQKVVIDNTNITPEIRKVFIDYAKSNKLTIGAHFMDTSKDDCLINSLQRMHSRFGQVYMHIEDVPKGSATSANDFVISAIFAMAKTFKKPNSVSLLKEGFDVVKIDKFERKDTYGYSNKAVFIDLDGTVRKSNGVQPYPIQLADIEILKNSEEVLKEYKAKGYVIIGVTNQSGVSKKILSAQQVKDCIDHTNKLLDNVIDDYHFCPHLPPTQICYCRKPQSGMGVLMQHKHKLNLSECIMVGDSTSDITFGTRLGMTCYKPDQFFKR